MVPSCITSHTDMNLSLFISIRLNTIALSLNKAHSIPENIKKINIIRRNNSIDSMEILIYSFCGAFKSITKGI